MDGSLITSEITRYGRSGKLKLKTPRRIQFLWKTFSFPFTFHPAKRKHPTRFWPQREALSSNSATSKRSRDDFLEKRGGKKKRRRNDLDVNRANSTSPSRIFELRNAFLERGIPDILRLLPWWWIIWARRLATFGDIRVPFVIADIRTWRLEEKKERGTTLEISVPGSGAV